MASPQSSNPNEIQKNRVAHLKALMKLVETKNSTPTQARILELFSKAVRTEIDYIEASLSKLSAASR